ncbi:hypothetical protein ACFL2Y_04145, partial [Candidatus Omnitrophota bacterium]
MFGKIVNVNVVNVGDGLCAIPRMALNEVDSMIELTWKQMPNYYPGVEINEFIIMPNYIQGIIVITNNVGATGRSPL